LRSTKRIPDQPEEFEKAADLAGFFLQSKNRPHILYFHGRTGFAGGPKTSVP
jgi:hypothetical protein